MRIAVVEDDADLAQALVGFLQALGHEVLVANNAPRALRAVGEHQPDVVIIDIGLPVFDGNFIAEEIRNNTAEPPRLIAMTGQRASVDASLFDDFVSKPFSPDEIVRALGAPGMEQAADDAADGALLLPHPSDDDSEDTLV